MTRALKEQLRQDPGVNQSLVYTASCPTERIPNTANTQSAALQETTFSSSPLDGLSALILDSDPTVHKRKSSQVHGFR